MKDNCLLLMSVCYVSLIITRLLSIDNYIKYKEKRYFRLEYIREKQSYITRSLSFLHGSILGSVLVLALGTFASLFSALLRSTSLLSTFCLFSGSFSWSLYTILGASIQGKLAVVVSYLSDQVL